MPLFGPPDVKKLESKRNFDGLVAALSYPKDENIRLAAAEALCKGEWHHPGLYPALEKSLTDLSLAVRVVVAKKLANHYDEKVIQKALDVLFSSNIPDLADFLIERATAKARNRPGRGGLETHVFLKALGRTGDPKVIPLLIELVSEYLSDRPSEPHFGKPSADALVQLGSLVYQPLLEALHQPRYRSDRLRLADTLTRCGWKPTNTQESVLYLAACGRWDEVAQLGAEAADYLIANFAVYERWHEEETTHAIWTLEKIGTESSKAFLLDILEHQYSWISRQAALAVAKMGDARALPRLVDSMTTPEHFQYVERALRDDAANAPLESLQNLLNLQDLKLQDKYVTTSEYVDEDGYGRHTVTEGYWTYKNCGSEPIRQLAQQELARRGVV